MCISATVLFWGTAECLCSLTSRSLESGNCTLRCGHSLRSQNPARLLSGSSYIHTYRYVLELEKGIQVALIVLVARVEQGSMAMMCVRHPYCM